MKQLSIILILILLIPSTIAISSGDKILAGDKTITLASIATDRVRVSINGQSEVIQQYQQKQINGVYIYVRKIISVTSPKSGKSSAELIIGTDDKTELIYVPYKEPDNPKTEITQNQPAKITTIAPIEQPIKTESINTEQQSAEPQKSLNQKQKPQIFNLLDFLKSIQNRLKFY